MNNANIPPAYWWVMMLIYVISAKILVLPDICISNQSVGISNSVYFKIICRKGKHPIWINGKQAMFNEPLSYGRVTKKQMEYTDNSFFLFNDQLKNCTTQQVNFSPSSSLRQNKFIRKHCSKLAKIWMRKLFFSNVCCDRFCVWQLQARKASVRKVIGSNKKVEDTYR